VGADSHRLAPLEDSSVTADVDAIDARAAQSVPLGAFSSTKAREAWLSRRWPSLLQ